MKRKKNIALFLAIIENDFSAAVLAGAEQGAKDFDANLFVFPMDLINAKYSAEYVNQYRYQYNILSSYMNAEDLDGIIVEYGTIVSLLDAEQKKRFLSSMEGIKTPIILLSEEVEGHDCVTVDNTSGLVDVLEHLIVEHDCRNIGFLSGPNNNCDAEERKHVYIETMKKHNLYGGEDWIAYGNFSIYVEEEVTRFLKKHPDMEALVCGNDSMAIGASSAMRKMGIEPGKDMYVTGFDDLIGGLLHEPALTTVKADPMELSYLAMKRLCGSDSSENETGDNKETFLTGDAKKCPYWSKIPTRMVRRESCGCGNFVPSKEWMDKLGVNMNWRENAQKQMREAEKRRALEHELGNVTREMVSGKNSEVESFSAILSALRRLEFTSAKIFMYQEFIEIDKASEWENPEVMNLVASFDRTGEENKLGDYDREAGTSFACKRGDSPVLTRKLISYLMTKGEKRHNMVIVPLFFGSKQLGLLSAQANAEQFQYAYDMAVQISNTLYFIAMNEEQKRMKNALEEANRYKTRFLANMSHEIRTPINAIIGFNEMILRENQDENIDRYAKDVQGAADVLLMLVGDILDFSKIEAGKMELTLGEYSLRNLLREVIGMINFKAEKKNLKLELAIKEPLCDNLIGDAGRIRQILLNLLSNAVKYTEKGTVTLSVHGVENPASPTTDMKNYALLHFSVKDTGIGIRKEDIPRLFNEFDRIDLKRNRHIEGSGLGINITTELLKLMNSELKVESTYGVGTEFVFDLYQEISEEQRSTTKAASGNASNTTEDKESSTLKETENKEKTNPAGFEAPGTNILVVDDNLMNRKVICSLLKCTKMNIDLAENGKKCVDMVKEKQYDVILLDHMMPEMDGLETLEALKGESFLIDIDTPVIALTANAVVGAREFYLENGFTDYLSKPVLPKNLYDMLKKYIVL